VSSALSGVLTLIGSQSPLKEDRTAGGIATFLVAFLYEKETTI